jgi:hypothetical protein
MIWPFTAAKQVQYHDQFRRNKWYPVHASKHLITDILKNELDFQELLLQTGKILSPYTRHKVAENNRAAKCR